jgi:hypothetical protein
MRKVIFYAGLIGMVRPSTWTSEHVSYAQDFYAGENDSNCGGDFRLEAALTRLLKKDWPA